LKKLVLVLIFGFGLNHAFGMVVTHPQVAKLLKEVGVKEEIKVVPLSMKDPHHFTPGPKTVKKLIAAKRLVLAPSELLPWQKNIISKRKGATFLMPLLHPENDAHARSHFWLYPDDSCVMKKWLTKQLNLSKSHCEREEREKSLIKKVKEIIIKKKVLVTITHDALTPLFETHQIPALALTASDHHRHMNPRQLKHLISSRKSYPNYLWITEEGLHSHQLEKLVHSYKKPSDLLISYDPQKESLEELLLKMEKLL